MYYSNLFITTTHSKHSAKPSHNTKSKSIMFVCTFVQPMKMEYGEWRNLLPQCIPLGNLSNAQCRSTHTESMFPVSKGVRYNRLASRLYSQYL